MKTKLMIILLLSFVYNGCSQAQNQNTYQKDDSLKLKKIEGTWLYHCTTGFTLLDMNDLENIMIYKYTDKEDHKVDQWFYKSKGIIKKFNENCFSLQTDKYVFIFSIKKDTLVTVYEDAEGDRLIKLDISK